MSDFRSARHISRRALVGAAAGAPLLLAGCGLGGSDSDETPEPTSTEEPTLAAPTATSAPIGSPVPGFLDPERWAGRSLTIATAGAGTFLESLAAAFFDPFEAATGASVRHEAFGRDGVNGLRDQVENEEQVWDVMLIPTEDVLSLTSRPYLEAIDYAIVDNAAMYHELAMQHAVGAMIYSTVQIHGYAEAQPPASWAEFWDLSRGNGTRALRKGPIGTLEFALLADGVQIADLYPLDVDRAFAKLEQIREATVFYEDSKQPVEFVRTGQVGLASAWNVRTSLPDVGDLVRIVWNGGMLSSDSWAIPRDAENSDVAMSFINYATRAVPAANFSLMQPYGPVNQNAIDLIPANVRNVIPNTPERVALQFFQDYPYWNERRETLAAQFEDWFLHPPSTPDAEA